MTATITTATVSEHCDHDRHRDCHQRGCVCGCHVLFRLIGR